MGEFMVVYGWAILVFLLAIGILAYFGVPQQMKNKSEPKTFLVDTEFGVLNCSGLYVQECGVHLDKCRDENLAINNSTYSCLTNVKFIR